MKRFELSAAQSDLWHAQQLHPDLPICVAQYTDLHGPVDRALLEACSGLFRLDGGLV